MVLEVEQKIENTTLTITLKGVLDFSTMGSLDITGKLTDSISECVMDFSELEFIDSTGIGTILSVLHEASDCNSKVTFVGMSPMVEELFDTIGVFKIKKTLLKERG
ncbi:STAS domain-containing protein [Paenibacillus alginolyticus]|uniref:STAS domain-containing protein n=1 Tax=Paenibacillus alginolyticus TaxID=59839 RepID=A0ABT4G9T7_9BACL|nr:STAS domain-containing protein [Paenibacillus alginolyticus]MCY9669892.1 STAS domain-containing protein [Paenibacillus alginolyticus]MCY9692936.1 STAS domain-containing protein [Paenibacillus alginolyticus]MEC0144323.1 STAS domain-containing protein [Paenibacillus alginolyticus]